ncbi:MAG: membrane protein insertase YidC, partial [Chloroflexi bacterium]|nr:membrane protein insertase YidC [Chloroflexota bacterium]
MWDAFINLFVQVLDFFHSYTFSYGWAIILLVLAIRVLTLPLTMQQLRTTKDFQEKQSRLQPKLDEIKKKYGKDRDKFAQEQMKLYKEEGMNPAAPLGGCLLALVQMPVWIGLYNALLLLAQQEKLTEGFL